MRSLLVLALLYSLQGCKDEIALSDACESITKSCEALMADSRCTSLRRDVLLNEYYIKKDGWQKTAFKQLNALELYVDCANKSTGIKYIDPYKKYHKKNMTADVVQRIRDYKERLINTEQDRLSTHFYAIEMLEQMIERSAISNDPHLLYWHWSRAGSKSAIEKLRIMDKNHKLEEFDLQYYMALDYSFYEPEMAISALLRSLELYPTEKYTRKNWLSKNNDFQNEDKGRLHFDIFRSLTTLYYSKKEFDKSYIFAKLLQINNDRSADTDLIVEQIAALEAYDLDKLENKADTIDDKIKSGTFTSTSI